jgi:hypothetical protein
LLHSTLRRNAEVIGQQARVAPHKAPYLPTWARR